MASWHDNITRLYTLLTELSITNKSGSLVSADQAFSAIKELTIKVRNANNTMYFIGNGASASMSSHMAADFTKNAKVHTQTFTDLALITALANDINYESVFSEPLKFRAKEGDLLVAISSSGESKNIIKAVNVAIDKGMHVVTLTGKERSNRLRSMGDFNFYIQADPYGDVETSHAAILHYWKDLVD